MSEYKRTEHEKTKKKWTIWRIAAWLIFVISILISAFNGIENYRAQNAEKIGKQAATNVVSWYLSSPTLTPNAQQKKEIYNNLEYCYNYGGMDGIKDMTKDFGSGNSLFGSAFLSWYLKNKDINLPQEVNQYFQGVSF